MSDLACPPTIYGPCAPYLGPDDLGACADCTGLEIGSEAEPGPDRPLVIFSLLSASRRVFMATGQRFFGCCEATFQPPSSGSCLVCLQAWSCCSCEGDRWPSIPLPFLPPRSIDAVTIDGELLPEEAYRLHADGWLLRIDGQEWPTCGPWSVRYHHGLDLPPEGVPLVGQYACELAKSCKPGSACSLGPNIRVVHRDGVDYAIAEPSEYRELGLTGFGPLDDWISLLRGGHVQEPPRIYRPGREAPAPILEPQG